MAKENLLVSSDYATLISKRETEQPSNINACLSGANGNGSPHLENGDIDRDFHQSIDQIVINNISANQSDAVEGSDIENTTSQIEKTSSTDFQRNGLPRRLELEVTVSQDLAIGDSKNVDETDGSTEVLVDLLSGSTESVEGYSQMEVDVSSIVDVSSTRCSDESLESCVSDDIDRYYERCVTGDVNDNSKIAIDVSVPSGSDANKEFDASTIERDGGDRLLPGQDIEVRTVAEIPSRSRERRSRERTRIGIDQRHMRKHSHPRSSSLKPPPTTPIKAFPEKKRQQSDAEIHYEHLGSDEHEKRSCFKSYSRRQIMTLISLCLADFASFLGMSIMAPFFPLEARNKGMDDVVMGFVFSVYALVMLIFSPIIGHILPLIGPKFIFLSGIFLTGMCTILFGVLDEIDDLQTFVFFCFLVRSFEALGAAACSTVSCTIVAEVFPDNVGAVFGIVETFVGLGMTAGPAIGGALYATGGYKLPFLVLGIIMILMIPLNWLILPGIQASNFTVKPKVIFQLLAIPKMIIISLAIVMLATSWAFLDPFLEPHLNEAFSMTPQSVGLIFLLLSATYSISSPVWGWIADRWEYTSTMTIIGSILTAVGLLMLGPSDLFPIETSYLWLDIVALIVMGIMVALALIPTFQAMMDVAIDNDFDDNIVIYSLISGIWSASYSLGDFIGPSLGGFLVGHYDFSFACTILAILMLIPAIVLFLHEIITATISRNKSLINKNDDIKETEKTPLLTPKNNNNKYS